MFKTLSGIDDCCDVSFFFVKCMGVLLMVRNEAHEQARAWTGRKEITAVFHFEKAKNKNVTVARRTQQCHSHGPGSSSFFNMILPHDRISLNETFTRNKWKENQTLGRTATFNFKIGRELTVVAETFAPMHRATSINATIARSSRFKKERIASKQTTLTSFTAGSLSS